MKTLIIAAVAALAIGCGSDKESCDKIEDSAWGVHIGVGDFPLVHETIEKCKDGTLEKDTLNCILNSTKAHPTGCI